MIYQKLHIGDPPYLLGAGTTHGFPAHKHIEIELFYCTRGSKEIVVDRQKHKIVAGELAIVGSMISHEVLETRNDPTARSITVEVGPAMLGEYFKPMENQAFPNPIFDLKQKRYKKLYELFEDIAALHNKGTSFSSLLIKGNIYKISAYILKEFVSENNGTNAPKKVNSINAVEKSLEYMYNNYDRKITVEEVAESCGYSKSNFCKIFKSITEDTFHNVLNKHRIKMACVLLESSGCSIEEIATRVGFSDSKSFCRIFKATKGISPGQYKKEKNV